MNRLKVYGIGYIPSETIGTHMFTRDQMTEELVDSVKGLPVYIEHDTTVQIGEVLHGKCDENGVLYVELLIYDNVLIISHLSDCISKNLETNQRKLFTGLSVGTSVKLQKVNIGSGEFSETYTAPLASRFTEFSIVAVPDSRGCVILDWEFCE